MPLITNDLLLDAAKGCRKLTAVLLLGVFAVSAYAHPILVPRPTLTLADRLLLSDFIVLAREDADRPFHFAPVKVIKGEPQETPIDVFMPSNIRNRLAANPQLTMVMGSRSGDDEWRAYGLADDEYLRVVQNILDSADHWQPRETDNMPRLRELAKLLGHPDIRLHELAYLEIGRASYASIREVGSNVPLEKVREMLNNPLYFQWRGLDIMLLGLSGSDKDQALVLKEMNERQQGAVTMNLAAWATAYLEVTGIQGIDDIADWYLRNPDRSREELQLITRALAGHATEDPGFRKPVAEAYSVLLATHPRSAPDIAHDLIAWQEWGLFDQVQALQPALARADPLGVYKVNLYLRLAKANIQASQP